MALVLNGSANTLTGLATAGAGIPGSEVVAASALANGGIIAVKNVIKTDQWTYSTIDTWADVTGLTISHALANSTNKLLLSYSLSVSAKPGAYNFNARLMDDTTIITQGDADGSVQRAANGWWGPGYGENQGTLANQFLYAPGNTDTNAYHVECMTPYSQGIYINRTFNWDNTANEYSSTVSTLTLMEVVA